MRMTLKSIISLLSALLLLISAIPAMALGTDGEMVSATEHRYENGVCLDCGDMIWEPNGPEIDYTYIGNAYAVTYFHPHSKSVCSLPEKYDDSLSLHWETDACMRKAT